MLLIAPRAGRGIENTDNLVDGESTEEARKTNKGEPKQMRQSQGPWWQVKFRPVGHVDARDLGRMRMIHGCLNCIATEVA